MHSVNKEFKAYKKADIFPKSFLFYNFFFIVQKGLPFYYQGSFIHLCITHFFACLCFWNVHTCSPHKKTTACAQLHVACLFLNVAERAQSQHTSPFLPGTELHGRARSLFDPYHV